MKFFHQLNNCIKEFCVDKRIRPFLQGFPEYLVVLLISCVFYCGLSTFIV